jgi:hypothetical protein
MRFSSIRAIGRKSRRKGSREKEMTVSIALFWGVALPALSWLALEIAEWGQD